MHRDSAGGRLAGGSSGAHRDQQVQRDAQSRKRNRTQEAAEHGRTCEPTAGRLGDATVRRSHQLDWRALTELVPHDLNPR